ncbi:MAG: DUF6457 domain-containing protein, partial [Gaiellaceae bacterium]
VLAPAARLHPTRLPGPTSVARVNDWLENARAALEERAGGAIPTLSQIEIDELLDLARVAAHESGDRTNAPLVCHLVGVARAQGDGRPLSELVDAVIRASDAR